jgi:hypothetical protein
MKIHTLQFGSSVATFKVWPSGTFVVIRIMRGTANVTKSITANRYVSGLIRFAIATGQLETESVVGG